MAGSPRRGAHFVTVRRLGAADLVRAARPGHGDGYDHVAREVAAAETGVALFDRSSDAKLRLEGPRAEALLRKLSGACRSRHRRRVAAPMLNRAAASRRCRPSSGLPAESWSAPGGPEQIDAALLLDRLAQAGERGEPGRRHLGLCRAGAGRAACPGAAAKLGGVSGRRPAGCSRLRARLCAGLAAAGRSDRTSPTVGGDGVRRRPP